MNNTVKLTIKLVVLAAFSGLLLSVILDWGGRFELICCTVATIGAFILFKQKKEDKMKNHS